MSQDNTSQLDALKSKITALTTLAHERLADYTAARAEISALRADAAHKEQESCWIDAEQQLPDDETTVLIALNDGEVWTGYHEGDQWFYVSADPLGSQVTHWMHLPEPPVRG